MNYLAGYGSLIHPNETKRHTFTPTCQEVVRIFGFQRIFNQEFTFRKSNGEKAAVLNVEPKRDSWINAVLLGGFDEQFHEELNARESGYDKVEVDKKDICGYLPISFQQNDKVFIYIGKKGTQNSEILPIEEYLSLCLEGANSFHGQFYEDFLDTTIVNKNILLRQYLE